MPLLRCEGLVKDYPGTRAVDGVDFDVEPGEIVGLLGPNGAGKSTTFRMACGLIAPTEGRIFLHDTDVTRWPMYLRAQHGLGYLPQDQSIFSRLSVEDNIFAILELRGQSRRAAGTGGPPEDPARPLRHDARATVNCSGKTAPRDGQGPVRPLSQRN